MTLEAWVQGTTYSPGSVVSHNGKYYEKLDDVDQSEPDEIDGGWLEILISKESLDRYQKTVESFSTYEARVIQHQQQQAQAKQSALEKLNKLGITTEELEALLN